MNRLIKILNELGLESLLPTFGSNGITDEILEELNDDDLKGMGITSLGDRKRILKAIKDSAEPTTPVAAPPATPAPAAPKSGSGNEEEIWNGSVDGMKVRITTHRAIFPNTTLALANIGSVEFFRADGTPAITGRSIGAWSTALTFGLFGGIFLSGECMEIGVPFMLVAIVAAMVAMGTKDIPEGPPTYHCRIAVAGTHQNLVSSFDPTEVRACVDALDKAIMQRHL